MLVKLTKAYEEVAKKSHRMRLDALEAFTWHSNLGFLRTYGYSATGTANGERAEYRKTSTMNKIRRDQ